MRTDKPDVNHLDLELHDGDEPIIVPADVEHKMLISDSIHAIERFLDVGE